MNKHHKTRLLSEIKTNSKKKHEEQFYNHSLVSDPIRKRKIVEKTTIGGF